MNHSASISTPSTKTRHQPLHHPYQIRPRPVSYGNPSFESYHGTVYTIEPHHITSVNQQQQQQQYDGGWNDTDWDQYRILLQSPYRPLIEESHHENESDENDTTFKEVRNMVAMIQVPPNQVPDGILQVSRAHRPYIRHVRILMETPPPLQHPIINSTTGTTKTTMDKDRTTSESSHLDQDQKEEEPPETSGTDITSQSLSTTVPTDRTYLILFELEQEAQVIPFLQDLHGQPYTYLDDTVTCHVVPVLAISGAVVTVSPSLPSLHEHRPLAPSSPTTTNTTSNDKTILEDYNCAVCLESMELRHRTFTDDETPFHESQSILTTVCNHSFHMDCLEQWQDSPCPVCRYDHAGLNDTTLLSQCHVCATTHHNYICLICGIVSCGGSGEAALPPPPLPGGDATTTHDNSTNRSCQDTSENFEIAMIQQRQRYQIVPNSHAWKHYRDTLHVYAVCTDTQHVWDFAGQGYVHRLLQNKDDGKLVEVSDPMNTTSQERSSSPGLTQAQEGEVVHRKLESFANQYYTLLKSQLEQQRTYYESRLDEIRREYSKSTMSTTTHPKPKKRVDTAADLIMALKQERQQLTQRLDTIQEKCRKVNSDVTFLHSLNESLEANQVSLRQQIQEAQRERAETRQMIDESLPPLQEKVTMLMLQLESTSNNTITSAQTEITISSNDSRKKPAAKR